MALILTIVRHGNTFAPGEAPRRIGARTDLPLVASGVAQADRLGRFFADREIRFDAVLSSPLERARQTAIAIVTHQPRAIEIVPWPTLSEIDHGPDENRTEDEVEARIGRAAIDRWERDATAPPDWITDDAARRTAWRALFEGGGTNHMLLVTSNGAARFALIAHPLLAIQTAAMPSLKLRTGAWGRIAVTSGVPRIMAWDVRP